MAGSTLEVPFYDAPLTTWRAHYYPRSIGKILGRDGALTGDAGCGCRPLWYLIAAAAVGVGVGIYARGEQKKKPKRRQG